MTHSFTSSSLSSSSSSSSSDKRDETPPSSEIRADIDQTRASVGEKIDQLQARLDPNRLKQQAQETVQEMISDTATQMTDYVRTHRDEMVHSLTSAARRNPLPTALVGLGLGWQLLESMAGNKSHEDDWEAERRYRRMRNEDYRYERNRFEGSTGRSYVSQGRGQFMEDDYSLPSDAPDYGRSGYPVRSESQSQSYQNQRDYGNGHQQHGNPLAKAANAVKDTVGDVAGEIKDRVSDATQGIKERAGEMTHEVKDRIGGTVDDMRYQGERLTDRGQHMSEQWRDRGERTLDRLAWHLTTFIDVDRLLTLAR